MNRLVLPVLLALALGGCRTTTRAGPLSAATLAMLGSLKQPVLVRAFISEKLPRPLQGKARGMQAMLRAYAKASPKIDLRVLDPKKDDAAQLSALEHGVEPLQLQIKQRNKMEVKRVYFSVVFSRGKQRRVLSGSTEIGRRLEYRISAQIHGVSRSSTVAFATGHGEPSAADELSSQLEKLEGFKIISADLTRGKGAVPAGADVLVLVGPRKPMGEAARMEIDQMLMAGKAVVYLVDGMVMKEAAGERDAMDLNKNVVGLQKQMAGYGVEINHDVVMNKRTKATVVMSGTFMSAVLPEPYVAVGDFNQGSPITGGVRQQIAVGPCSMKLARGVNNSSPGLRGTVLLRSSANTWRKSDAFRLTRAEQKPTKQRGPFPLAVHLQGAFRSASPKLRQTRSPKTAQLVVIGGAGVVKNESVDMLAQNPDLLRRTLEVVTLPAGIAKLWSAKR